MKKTKEVKAMEKTEELKEIQNAKKAKEKTGLKASRKRKLKEVRRKLSDISSIIESISLEDEKQIDLQLSENESPSNLEKELQAVESLQAAVHGLQVAVLLIDSTLE